MPALRKLRLGDQEFQASVGYMVEVWWSAYGFNLCLAAS